MDSRVNFRVFFISYVYPFFIHFLESYVPISFSLFPPSLFSLHFPFCLSFPFGLLYPPFCFLSSVSSSQNFPPQAIISPTCFLFLQLLAYFDNFVNWFSVFPSLFHYYPLFLPIFTLSLCFENCLTKEKTGLIRTLPIYF